MINYIWLLLVIIGILSAVYGCIVQGSTEPLKAVTDGALDMAKASVTLALGLIGVMALFLGLMKIAEEAGLIRLLARIASPVMRFLFPKLPHDHPAIGAMLMNIIANFLGLGNAATPLGLKAMEELQKINPVKDEASDEMCTFLVINTSGWALIPATMIAVRASLNSTNPENIILPTFIACTCATIVGIITVKILGKLKIFRRSIPADAMPEEIPDEGGKE
jgi:spore maturation protein A